MLFWSLKSVDSEESYEVSINLSFEFFLIKARKYSIIQGGRVKPVFTFFHESKFTKFVIISASKGAIINVLPIGHQKRNY